MNSHHFWKIIHYVHVFTNLTKYALSTKYVLGIEDKVVSPTQTPVLQRGKQRIHSKNVENRHLLRRGRGLWGIFFFIQNIKVSMYKDVSHGLTYNGKTWK